jgi:hypothetical protein
MNCERVQKTHVRDVMPITDSFYCISGVWVHLDYTHCHLGGKRRWFLCPDCNRRCAILYPVKCRICLNLHYASEHEGVTDRMYRAAFKARARLGQSTGGLGPAFPPKPKLMRWHTYFKARAKAQIVEGQILSGLSERFHK